MTQDGSHRLNDPTSLLNWASDETAWPAVQYSTIKYKINLPFLCVPHRGSASYVKHLL